MQDCVRNKLWLGAMQFGASADESAAHEIFEIFQASGGVMIDTSDNYADGKSELITGKLVSAERQRFFLSSKVGNPAPSISNSGGLSARWINEAIKRSLDRLGTSYLDLYLLHQEDDGTPLEETLSAIKGLMEAKLVHNWGFSNFRPWKIAEMVRIADQIGLARPLWAQLYYHMLNRVAEADYLPACAHFSIRTAAYSPMARGVLTGKYADAAPPEDSRAARGDARLLETEFLPETLAAAASAARYAQERGVEPGALAIQWALANRHIGSIVAGPRTPEQMQNYLDALDCPYADADERVLSALCNPGQMATPGHFDPRYPLTGRVTRTDRRGAPR
ncbi:MAG: aldo/keto reductase [Hyphomicrobiales bacterium]|nr:aldo/keto reductase [Hyphomicrobiales bacterium]